MLKRTKIAFTCCPVLAVERARNFCEQVPGLKSAMAYGTAGGMQWTEAAGYDLAELEDNLRLTPEARMRKQDRTMAEYFKREEFLEFFQRGWNFIQTHHGNTR